eukprot:Nitzschia sp. Nitz4//scaffold30_size153850//142724//144259//NITZ4_002801-RA/size153850-processed-gene-0.26-mRNA-1//1//CDS//3329547333//1733//frame0
MTTIALDEDETSPLEDIRLELTKLAEEESNQRKENAWLTTQSSETEESSSSPRGVEQGAALLQRYEKARDLYLQHRFESLVVDHLLTFDPQAYNSTDDTQRCFEFPEYPDNQQEIQELHTQSLATLQTQLEQILTHQSQLRDNFDSVSSRRQELQQMFQDLQAQDQPIQETEGTDMDVDNVEDVDDQALALEQERIEALQQSRRRLQEELAQLERETEQVELQSKLHQEQILTLQRENNITEELDTPCEGQEYEQLENMQAKADELQEMASFYRQMTQITEVLGGVKIVNVQEGSQSRLLQIHMLMYEKHNLLVTLHTSPKNVMKLQQAQWLLPNRNDGPLLVHPNLSKSISHDDRFSLVVQPLDDLVQYAKSALSPPDDLTFIVREALGRLRFTQDRVNDIAVLRQTVLTKVQNNNQVVCSLNDGIVVVLQMYDLYVRVEQMVGVSGWSEDVVQQIQNSLPKTDDPNKPLSITEIVHLIQDQVEQIKSEGHNPRTPRFPTRGTFPKRAFE